MNRPLARLALCAAFAFLPVLAAAAPDAARQLHALLAEDWEWTLRHDPDFATFYGDHRFDDRLTDRSPERAARQKAHVEKMLARLKRIPREQLRGEDRVSRDMAKEQFETALAEARLPVLRTRVLSANVGVHQDISHLLLAMPLRNEADARKLLARLAAVPLRVRQDIALLREGKARGWVTHRASLADVPGQIDLQLTEDATRTPWFEPFTRLPDAIPAARRSELSQAAQATIRDHVQPALRELRRFVVDELLPASPENGSMSLVPGGNAIYAHLVRTQTTLDLDVRAIHDIGLREVARLRGEMDKLIASTGFKGSFEDWVKHLNTDPRYFYTSGEDLLTGYRDIAKRVDPMLPKLFAELPRTPYGIRAIPAHEGEKRAEYYTQASADGSRPGWFSANVLALNLRPKWEMEALFLHEAVPGHHLQGTRALELKSLPPFRRNAWYVAYGEGWALYAEGLGADLGLYTQPESRFGQLRMELWRAARLVVDTGIHALGWNREQAIAWMTERTGIARDDVVSEVDRYYALPAQALGYKLGQMEIVALRDRARAALGDRFDIRRFHMVILDHGPVPLTVLRTLVDEWISQELHGATRRNAKREATVRPR